MDLWGTNLWCLRLSSASNPPEIGIVKTVGEAVPRLGFAGQRRPEKRKLEMLTRGRSTGPSAIKK